ncbi:IS1182 family transposase [Microbispora sp. NBC_01189]|uniref:IS1182 family transposase n=1 Tax=Microbispora sp. NBC_01189 TaxID=2903583 RepID=UPI002E1578BF|nr:IS1182 family transposase [Microbispora sp. NBC_01189]
MPEVARAIRAMYRGKRQPPLPVRVRDELGELFADARFAGAFGAEGKPGWSPGRLALITVFQRVENLTDRQAAEAVRADLSWKYALGLELDDPGFDASVLSEFRSRVVEHGLEELALDLLVAALIERGLLKAGGKQRTDSTHVISAVRDLNRLELAGECVRAALEALSAAAPHWVQQVLDLPGWADRYRSRIDSWRLPASETKREELVRAYGSDGYALVAAVYAPFSPAWLRQVPAVDALRVMLIQNYVRTTDNSGREVVKRRRPLDDGGEGLPPGRWRLTSPYDTDTRWAAKGDDLFWNGYKVHISETCHTDADADADAVRDNDGTDGTDGTDGQAVAPPNLITNVATTDATVPDAAMTEKVHQGLQRRGLLPHEHYVDSGYASAELIVGAREAYGLTLITPVLLDQSPQARAQAGYDRTAFAVDWDNQQVVCPQGQASASWSPCLQRGSDAIVVMFPATSCRPCPVRTQCTTSKRGSRQLTLRPQAFQQALDSARAEQTSKQWQDKYKIRAGVEGTMRQAIAVTGIRRARYRGIDKVHLEHVFSAVASTSSAWTPGGTDIRSTEVTPATSPALNWPTST